MPVNRWLDNSTFTDEVLALVVLNTSVKNDDLVL